MTYQVPAGAGLEGWLERNLKWLIPVVIVAGIVTVAGLVVAFALVMFTLIRGSDAAQMALRQARADPRVEERLGSPIETGWWVSGSLNTSGPSGNAALTIPVYGPRASGRLHLRARKELGEWRLEGLVLELTETGERLDLLSETPAAEGHPPRVSPPLKDNVAPVIGYNARGFNPLSRRRLC